MSDKVLPKQLRCKVCSEKKPIDEFPINKQSKYGHKNICKNPCYKNINANYYKSKVAAKKEKLESETQPSE